MLDVDDIMPFGDPLTSTEAVRVRPIEWEKELALIGALPSHSFGDGHEVYTGNGTIIALCPTAEWAGLICRAINTSYEIWFLAQSRK